MIDIKHVSSDDLNHSIYNLIICIPLRTFEALEFLIITLFFKGQAISFSYEKNLNFCSKDEQNSQEFGMIERRVDNDKRFILE